jgi:hypothetical protein
MDPCAICNCTCAAVVEIGRSPDELIIEADQIIGREARPGGKCICFRWLGERTGEHMRYGMVCMYENSFARDAAILQHAGPITRIASSSNHFIICKDAYFPLRDSYTA